VCVLIENCTITK